MQTHQYLADAQDSEAWMSEKEPLVTNVDYGKDEDTAQVENKLNLFYLSYYFVCHTILFFFVHLFIYLFIRLFIDY